MFTITVTENARIDLGFFKKAERTAILDTLARQLATEPLKPTRNRKPLDPNVLGRWELRVGDVRDFYDVDEAALEVTVKAVGWKQHNKLFFRGKEQTL